MNVESFRGYLTKTVNTSIGGRTLQLIVPRNSDELLESPAVIERFEQDEYLPYWTQLWPSSVRLAHVVSEWSPKQGGEGSTVLELGCGLGLVSLMLAARGFRVTASDYDEDALAFVRENARRNNLPAIEARFVDWRETYDDLSVDRIVAADVLYETRHLRPVAEFVSRHLAPEGFALLVDPCRMVADDFSTVARHCGLDIREESTEADSASHSSVARSRAFTLTARRGSI